MTEKPNNQNDEVKVTTPPNTIKEKVGSGGIPGENIKKAEETFVESSQDFAEAAQEDLNVIVEAISGGKSGEKTGAQVIREVNAASFELKSNAGMFDCPLVADISTSLFQLTDMLEDISEAALDVINLHYQSIRAAMAMGGKAENPEDAKALIKGLMGASSKVLQDQDS